ncbi:PAS domain-containing protein [Jannaschia sp. S6380]|uniref:PAS domain-containing protein n=1 Tax=Jannaschia sp. S6380 TaxID=2926408 RepID=UPI001FF56C70|nr:PAS domain-containing protein [Jannaschia sp. S6380]MCK0166380.1 PAS domain-containing protein [Jannaschia sp. S6380]
MADLNGIDGGHGMRCPIQSRARRYWSSLRVDGTLPRRSALDPARMGPLMGHALVLDRLRHGTVRVRLGGWVAQDLMGMDVRGLPVRAFFDTTDRTRAETLMEDVFDRPSILEMDLISDDAAPLLTASMTVLPLLDVAGLPTKALAIIVPDRFGTTAPRRFGITKATMTPLAGAARAPGPGHPLRRVTDRPATAEPALGFAEAVTPFRGRGTLVPYLRVVK